MKFDAELRLNGKTATGIPVPDDIIDALGAGRRPRVAVSFNGYTFHTSLGTMFGQVLIPVSAAVRKAAGAVAGDRLAIDIALSTTPTPITVPEDLQTALDADAEAQAFFEGLTASQKRGYTDWIEQARSDETRRRRLEHTLVALQGRRTRR